MCDCGAPWSNRIGGPDPPITPLISAPLVFTRTGVPPGDHLVGSTAGACADAGRALRLDATPRAVTCIIQSRRFMSVMARDRNAQCSMHNANTMHFAPQLCIGHWALG